MYEAESFAPLGLSLPLSHTHGLRRGLHSYATSRLPTLLADPRLAPWAAFFRRFAASLIAASVTATSLILTAEKGPAQ